MQNSNYQIVYSLKVHLILQQRGFKELIEMKNPNDGKYNCWVYEKTEKFLEAFSEVMKEVSRNG